MWKIIDDFVENDSYDSDNTQIDSANMEPEVTIESDKSIDSDIEEFVEEFFGKKIEKKSEVNWSNIPRTKIKTKDFYKYLDKMVKVEDCVFKGPFGSNAGSDCETGNQYSAIAQHLQKAYRKSETLVDAASVLVSLLHVSDHLDILELHLHSVR